MSTDIVPGDVVQVIKPTPCCNNYEACGMVYTVATVETDLMLCTHCRNQAVFTVGFETFFCGIEVSRLKKFKPLAELETVERREEITA